MLALGGGSWPSLGSDGAWQALLQRHGVALAPLLPAVCQALLRAAGFAVTDVPEGHLCCGWAGTYSVLQPGISQRLRDRKRESESLIQSRFQAAKAEIEAARASGVYDQFLINDDLKGTIERAVQLVTRERAKRTGT